MKKYNLVFKVLPKGRLHNFKIKEAVIVQVGELIKIEFFWRSESSDLKWLERNSIDYSGKDAKMTIGYGEFDVLTATIKGLDLENYDLLFDSPLKSGYEIWFAPIGFDSDEKTKTLYSFKVTQKSC